MFKTIEGAAKCEIRPVIHFLNARNVLPSEIHHQICQVYGNNVLNDGRVRKCVWMLNERWENMHDEAQSGRTSLVNDDLVCKVNERVRDDKRFSFWSVPALSSDFKDSTLWNVNKNPTDATVCMYLFISKLLYKFQVSQHPSSGVLKTIPAASSTGHTTCTTTPLCGLVLIRPSWRRVAVQVVWPVPEAAGTVFSTPDDGCCDIRNM